MSRRMRDTGNDGSDHYDSRRGRTASARHRRPGDGPAHVCCKCVLNPNVPRCETETAGPPAELRARTSAGAGDCETSPVTLSVAAEVVERKLPSPAPGNAASVNTSNP